MIATKRLQWFGHVSRMPEDRLPNYLIDWKPKHAKRSRGRPRKTLNDVYVEDAEKRLDISGLTIDCMKMLAADRKGWRNTTRQSCMTLIKQSFGSRSRQVSKILIFKYVR